MCAKRRSYLYLGGVLGSVITVMSMASIANIFFKSPLLLDVNLYVGLAVFCGYVVYDTQLMIERAALGSRDFAWHAAELFIDFISIFVRVLVIMLKNAAKKNQQEAARRNSNSNESAQSKSTKRR